VSVQSGQMQFTVMACAAVSKATHWPPSTPDAECSRGWNGFAQRSRRGVEPLGATKIMRPPDGSFLTYNYRILDLVIDVAGKDIAFH
jgi:hypothetical protein